MLESFIEAAGSLLTLETALSILIGSFVGLVVGALPGLGAVVAVVLLLPLSFQFGAGPGVILLVSAYTSAEYGGSISSVLLRIPGTPAAVVTMLDGVPLRRKEGSQKALSLTLIASTIGGLFGAVVLTVLSVPLASVALRFSDPEFFLLGLVGLFAVTALAGKSKARTGIGVVLGLLLGTVGVDAATGVQRFTFGQTGLYEGLDMITVVVGLFAVTEVFAMARGTDDGLLAESTSAAALVGKRASFSEVVRLWKPLAVGSTIGSTVGVFPGMGAGPAAWLSYAAARSASRRYDEFGHGNPEGVVAPEAANNAAVGGAMVPVLAFGIPGSASMAVVMGALIVKGIVPGPRTFTENPVLVYSIFLGFGAAVVGMYLCGRLLTPLIARLIRVPRHYLVPIITVTSLMGVYSATTQVLPIWIMLGVAVAALWFREASISLPGVVLGFVLSPIIEESLRRSLSLSDGDFMIFLTRPYSIGIIVVTSLAGLILWAVQKKVRSAEAKLVSSSTMS